ncbi:MAG: protein kinase [Myxococcota bacterium]
MEKIGNGGQADIYKGHLYYAHGLGRPCAIKVLREEIGFDIAKIRARFLNEAYRGLELTSDHPNLLTTRDFGVSGGRLFIITDWIDGADLMSASLLLKGRFTVIRAIARSSALALAHIHDHGFVHRDVTARNIMLSSTGVVKLIDLGLLQRESAPIGAGVEGTIAYRSPEEMQYLGTTHRSDLFSLGVVLYQLVCGRLPYGNRSIAEVQRLMMKGPPPPLPPDTPDDLNNIITGLMRHMPESRPCVDEVVSILDSTPSIATRHEIATLVATWQTLEKKPEDERETPVALSGELERLAALCEPRSVQDPGAQLASPAAADQRVTEQDPPRDVTIVMKAMEQVAAESRERAESERAKLDPMDNRQAASHDDDGLSADVAAPDRRSTRPDRAVRRTRSSWPLLIAAAVILAMGGARVWTESGQAVEVIEDGRTADALDGSVSVAAASLSEHPPRECTVTPSVPLSQDTDHASNAALTVEGRTAHSDPVGRTMVNASEPIPPQRRRQGPATKRLTADPAAPTTPDFAYPAFDSMR